MITELKSSLYENIIRALNDFDDIVGADDHRTKIKNKKSRLYENIIGAQDEF